MLDCTQKICDLTMNIVNEWAYYNYTSIVIIQLSTCI